MNFDEIWPKFSWVVEEMRGGMCFFEGYILSMGESNLLAPLSQLIGRADSYSFTSSTWSDETTESDWDREYDPADYVDFFNSGKIWTLHFNYEFCAGNTRLAQRLMFDKNGGGAALEIICYRDPILSSPDPKEAIAAAVLEFRALKRLFRGDVLFLGPDTLDYPTNASDYPQCWLRIE